MDVKGRLPKSPVGATFDSSSLTLRARGAPGQMVLSPFTPHLRGNVYHVERPMDNCKGRL